MSDHLFGLAIIAITVLGAFVLIRGWWKFAEFMKSHPPKKR